MKIIVYFFTLLFTACVNVANCVDAENCFTTGLHYSSGKNTSLNIPQAMRNFKRACELKHAQSCVEVAVLYENGKDMPQDFSQAKHYFQLACNLNLQNACRWASEVGTSEYFNKVNKRIQWFNWIKNNGGTQYFTLAQHHFDRNQVQEAMTLMQKSCSEFHYQPACEWLKSNFK